MLLTQERGRVHEPRVPLALQSVFLRGNRDHDINTSAPERNKSWWRLYTRTQSVKADVVAQQNERDNIQHESQKPKTSKPKSFPKLSPQQYLDGLIRSRGYSAVPYPVLSCAYHNKPSPLQIASYGVHVLNLVITGDCNGLKELLKNGLSPNACNTHGESIIDHVCRRVDDVCMLNVLLDAGCVVQRSDQNGRTPLHHAFWASIPNFAIVEKLLEHDLRLLYMADRHGHLPLSYIREEHWSKWLQFFQARKEQYWPRIASSESSAAPPLTKFEPHSFVIRDPENALPVEVAKLVASGQLKIKEAKLLMKTFDREVDRSYVDLVFEDSDFDEDDISCSSSDHEPCHATKKFDDSTSETTISHDEDDYDDDNDDSSRCEALEEDDDDSSDSELLEQDESDSESWCPMKRTSQGLSTPNRQHITW